MAWALYIPAKAQLAQILMARAWSRTLADGVPRRPWPWADMTMTAQIAVPRLGERAIVLDNASGEAMAFGPGHMLNTPEIGAPGTAMIAAHRDTSFAFLRHLKPGDVIETRTRNGARHLFRVSETRIVKADASGLDPAAQGPSGARLALITCYPFAGVLHSPWRYVVIADRLPAIAAR